MTEIEITLQYLASQGLSPSFPKRFWAKVNKDGPVPEHMPHLGQCWVWTGALTHDGYGRIRRGSGNASHVLAHVASYLLHHGPVPDGLCIIHRCDCRRCVNKEHIKTGTNLENTTDMIAKRRDRFSGEEAKNHKLNSEQVVQIRLLYQVGELSQLRIAQMFGVSESAICHIIARREWKHIKEGSRTM